MRFGLWLVYQRWGYEPQKGAQRELTRKPQLGIRVCYAVRVARGGRFYLSIPPVPVPLG